MKLTLLLTQCDILISKSVNTFQHVIVFLSTSFSAMICNNAEVPQTQAKPTIFYTGITCIVMFLKIEGRKCVFNCLKMNYLFVFNYCKFVLFYAFTI